MENNRKRHVTTIALIGVVAIVLILVLGTVWLGRSASRDTEKAVRSVSLLYLEELAGRREQVVANNLADNINTIHVAIGLLTDEDLSDAAHLRAYQAQMKQLFKLEKFAFVDEDGLIYTSLGTQDDIDRYAFDYRTITGPEISVKDVDSPDKKVVIAVPVDDLFHDGKKLVACFMEIDMDVMLQGVSMQSSDTDTTFCNIYTGDGVALSDTVLGGLAVEANLLEAMERAEFEDGYSLEKVRRDFEAGERGEVCFSYNGIRETLSYVPVEGTNWLLTYLIRESVISDQINSISSGIIRRSLGQSVLILIVLAALFGYIYAQTKRNARLALEKETAETASRVMRQELEEKLKLQKELLARQEVGDRQSKLITALAADYWSVYYLELDKDEGICYQAHEDVDDGFKVGERFRYLQSVTDYANTYIPEPYRDEFLHFIQPDNIREGLKNERVISYRYMVHRHGRDSYEMVRFAGVRHPEDREDHLVHAVGACFTNVDTETRKTLEQSQALGVALTAAEEANRAKTAFLSNMSHEIRTPMNAIIGLNSIAMNDPETPEKTRGYLEKIAISANHLLSIINDILDMSRIESGRMVIKREEFSLSRMLEQVNTMISGQCREKGLHYECRIKGRVDEYYIGDDMKLRQVMINILGNAVKFTPEGGTVTFVVEDVARFNGNATLRFVMRDNGIGMSKEYLPKLFDAFTQENSSSTNRYGSTGLGMPITKSLVELMNGTIQVESEKGVGTTFTVTVTLAESERRSEGDHSDIQPHMMNVLVIDDDPVACEHAQLVLGEAGINCESALSGAQGLELVRMRHARMEPYNLILVDWKMPEMDGVETTRRIREIVGDDTAIIILTSYNWDDIIEEARAAGVDTFVPKPLFAGTVMDEFCAAFREKQQRASAQKADLKGKRVLLAEDVAVNAEIIMMVLSMREMQVDHAENGKIAVEMFEAHPVDWYDAVLMDMRMPEMDGLEATRVIRAMDRADAKTTPIIALTANAFDEDVQRSMQAGLNAHLSKPVEPATLYETLENLIRT